MKNYKRIDGDYTIQLVNDDNALTLESKTVNVVGNLEVSGNLTYINTEELRVTDPFILLNKRTGPPSNAFVIADISKIGSTSLFISRTSPSAFRNSSALRMLVMSFFAISTPLIILFSLILLISTCF